MEDDDVDEGLIVGGAVGGVAAAFGGLLALTKEAPTITPKIRDAASFLLKKAKGGVKSMSKKVFLCDKISRFGTNYLKRPGIGLQTYSKRLRVV